MSGRRRLNKYVHYGFFVYAVYASDGTCLYVGRSKCPRSRMGVHKSKSPWWHDGSRIRWTQCSDEESMRDTEWTMIRSLDPQHNKYKRA